MSVSEDLVGQILLGKLEVVRKLGGGGMGVVYEVEHRLTGHRRALKVVQAQFADRPRFMKRLLREAKVAGTLGSDHVVETYDAGRLEDGSAYVLMELLEGRSLYAAMQEEGPLAPRRVARIMAQVAEGMAIAHESGIIHRDLKPENIFLVDDEEGERVKVLDFGVSKFEPAGDEAPTRLTAEGTLVGTPYYMSPEQAGGRKVDAHSDIYAMGVMMYEALTGRLPFEADSVGELFVKIGAGECVPLRIRRPDLDEAWHALVHRAFDRDPSRRFASAEDLRRELLRLAEGGATAARARTISDGVRATLGYGEPLPPPPGAPAIPELEDPPAESEHPSLETPALTSPSTPPPAVTPRRALPGWGWAAIGAGAVLALVVPWQLTREPLEPPPGTVASPEAPPDHPEASLTPHGGDRIDIPPVGEFLPAADAGAGLDLERPSHPRDPTRTSPARAAGLDPNPYR